MKRGDMTQTTTTCTPMIPQKTLTVTTRVRRWPDRLRLAAAIISGRTFSLSCDVLDVEVSDSPSNA
jgi:hypothetical protein